MNASRRKFLSIMGIGAGLCGASVKAIPHNAGPELIMKPKADLILETAGGKFAARDYGGTGRDVLLVHGTGHNLEVWSPLAKCLGGSYRVVSFDLRGHGQTRVDSATPEQYWQDIASVSEALGLANPLLIGHSTGGYAVTAYAASGGDCSGLIILDGFVLDKRKTPDEVKEWTFPKQQLWEMFRYGWVTDRNGVENYIAEVCDKASTDWLNAGIDVRSIEAFTRRSFVAENDLYVRRPTMEEIAVVSNPDPAASVYPSVDIYGHISVPIGFIVAKKGLYANRTDDVVAIVNSNKYRYFLEIEGGHNLHMQKPSEICRFVRLYFS